MEKLVKYLEGRNHREFAERAGLTPALLSQLKAGLYKPSQKRCREISAATDGEITPADLRPDWAELFIEQGGVDGQG